MAKARKKTTDPDLTKPGGSTQKLGVTDSTSKKDKDNVVSKEPEAPRKFGNKKMVSTTPYGDKDKQLEYKMRAREFSEQKEYDDAIEFNRQYFDSPRYKDMLRESIFSVPYSNQYLDSVFQRIDTDRRFNLGSLPASPTVIFSEAQGDPYLFGTSNGLTGEVKIYKPGFNRKDLHPHEVSHSVDRPSFLQKINPNFIYGQRTMPDRDTKQVLMSTPELEDTPLYKLNNTESLEDFKAVEDRYYYLTEPTEVRARLNVIRNAAKDLGIYDPFTEKVGEDFFEKLMEEYSPELDEALDDLFNIYESSDIIDMLNSISGTSSGSDKAATARYGLSVGNDGIPTDPLGYLNPENIGNPVRIPSNRITMRGVNEPLLGISNTGDMQVMLPNREYLFSGDSVTEYPINNNNMAKKKKTPKKQFGGGMPDLSKLSGLGNLLQGFKGSDPSSWMNQIQSFASENKYTVPTGPNTSFMNARSILGVSRDQADKALSSITQMQGLQSLFDQFTKREGAGYNPMNYMVSPTRGFRYGGFIPTYQKGGTVRMVGDRIIASPYTSPYYDIKELSPIAKSFVDNMSSPRSAAVATPAAAEVNPLAALSVLDNNRVVESTNPSRLAITDIPAREEMMRYRVPANQRENAMRALAEEEAQTTTSDGASTKGFSGRVGMGYDDGDNADEITDNRRRKSIYLDEDTGMSVVRDKFGNAYLYNPDENQGVYIGELSDSNASVISSIEKDPSGLYNYYRDNFGGFRQGSGSFGSVDVIAGDELFGGVEYPSSLIPKKQRQKELLDFATKYGSNKLSKKDYEAISKTSAFKRAAKKDPSLIPSMQLGGAVDTEMQDNQPLHIQTEVGEMISMPDNRIVPVKAKRRHSGMSDNEITDVLPPGSFVASRDKRMVMSKDDLAGISLGFGPLEYSEDGATNVPKEMTAADVMTKNKQTPADILKDISNKFPEVNRKDDAFSMMADELNLASRTPYIAAVRYLTERNKPKEQNELPMAKYGYMIPATQMPENPFADKLGLPGMEFQHGGSVPKAQAGLVAGLIGGAANNTASYFDFLSTIPKFFDTRKTLRGMEDRGNRFFDTSISQLRGLQGRQMQNLGMGTMASALPSLLASSDFATPDRSGQFSALAAMPQSVPRSYSDYQMSQARQGIRPYLNMASRNTASASQAMNMAQASQANMLRGVGDIANQRAMQDMGMRQNYLNQLGALRGQTAAEEAQKANYQTNFANQRLSNLGSIGANYFNQASGIDKAGTYGRMNLESQRLGYVNELKQSQLENRMRLYNAPSQFMRGIGSSAGQLGGMDMSSLFKKQVPELTPLPTLDANRTVQSMNPSQLTIPIPPQYQRLPDASQTTFQPSFGAFNPNVTGSLTSQLPSRYFWEPSYKINIPQRPNYSNISLLDGYNNLWPR
jgi:hypothetical protein